MIGEATLTVKPPIKATSVTVCPSSVTVNVGSSTQLNAEVYPYNTQDKRIRWCSENCNIADVDPYTGCVCGKSVGTTYIYANAQDGSGVSGRCEVTVRSVDVTEISFSETSYTLEAIGATKYLYPTVYPSNATNKSVTWSSSDNSVVSVNQYGRIKAESTNGKSVASAVITARTNDGGYEASCTVYVDTREKVTVSKDGNFNKITFQNGKVWRCINCDMINNENNAGDTILKNRLAQNTYSNIVTDNYGNTGYYDPVSYTANEMRLIYLIDPYGFANYVQLYASEIHKGDILSIVNLKDNIYRTLFNTSPQYYRRMPSGTWYIASGPTSSTDARTVLSESELLFGTHPVYDIYTLLQFGSVLFELVGLRIGSLNLSGGNVQKLIKGMHKFFSVAYSVGQSVIEDDFASYIRDFAVNEITEGELETYRAHNYSMSWAYDLFSLSSSFEEAADRISDKPTLYKDIFDYCVVEPNYRLLIENRTGETEYIGNIREILGD